MLVDKSAQFIPNFSLRAWTTRQIPRFSWKSFVPPLTGGSAPGPPAALLPDPHYRLVLRALAMADQPISL